MACEIIVLSGFFTLYTIAVNEDLHFWSMEDIIKVFTEANFNTVLVIFLPYSVSWLYFSNQDKKMRLKKMEMGLSKPETLVLQFPDEKGEVRFTVMSDHVIYLRAADNYISIFYKNNDQVSEYLLRNSMKRMSELLVDTPIQRIHRSYMVNFAHVVALRKTPVGISLELDQPNLETMPVSKTFASEVTEAFLRYSKRN